MNATALFSQHYNFRHYTVSDGLPVARTSAIYQDLVGYMWIGTEGGLSRYDGKEFEFFEPANGFPGSAVYAISESAEGILIASDSGLVIYSYAKFNLYKYPKNSFNRIISFSIGCGNELILTTDAGLYEFKKGVFKKIVTGTPVDNLTITAICKDAQNRLWVGTDRNGLFLLRFKNGKYSNEAYEDQSALINSRIRGLKELSDGILWIATSGDGLFSMDGGTLTQLKLPESFGFPYYTSLHRDVAGNMWMGTWGSGLIQYNGTAFRNFNKSNGLKEDIITCVNSDRDGNVWIGSFNNGLFFYPGGQFIALTTDDGLADNNVTGITQDDEGTTWVSTVGGLSSYDGDKVTTWTKENGLSTNRLGAICTDGSAIYAGGMDGSVNVMRDGKITVLLPPDSIDIGEIISMLYTRDGSVWLGSVSSGLFRVINNKYEIISAGNVLMRNPIWSLYEDQKGVIWVGTSQGLFLLKDGSAIRPPSSGNRSPQGLTIYDVDGDETYIYMATQKSGIWRYNQIDSSYQVFNKSEGLGSLYTEGILWSNATSMYVMTMLGLDKVSFVNDTNQVRHFWYKDGIGTENFSPGAALYGKEGNLWFGSSDGVIIYSPIGERGSAGPPTVHLKRALLFNGETDWRLYSDSLLLDGLPYNPQLPYDQNSINFFLTGIQFGTGSNISFEYQLLGMSESWIGLLDGRTASFSNLPPGDYVFNVRAKNTNNVWGEINSFKFTIEPPFWKTRWFFVLVLLVMTTLSIVLLTTYRSFRTEFIRTHRSFYDHHLTTSRLVLLFGGSIYPVSGVLCRLFIPELQMDGFVQLAVGSLMVFAGIGTYLFEPFRRYATTFAYAGYSLLTIHIYYLAYVNGLHPVLVVTIMISLAISSVLLDNIRALVAYAFVILIATSLLMMLSSGVLQYNIWLLLLGVVISLIITLVTVVSRLNLFNRLIFADTTLNNSRSLVIAANGKGEVVYVSRSVKAVLGYQPEEVMGDGWWKVRSVDEVENAKVKERVASFKGTTAPYITTVTAKNGTKKWIQWVDTELPGDMRVGIGMDVSDRKEIEERYKHIVESATDIIYTADYKGNFTFINEVVTKITGFSNEDLIGKHFTDTVSDAWKEEVRSFYARQFRKKTVSTYMEFPITIQDGSTRWVGQTVRILFDEYRPGFIKGFQAIARDITDKKHYEEELEKLSLVASETINGVLICDPDGRIEWVNVGFTRMTGYEFEEVKGRLPGDVLAGDRTDLFAISAMREVSASSEGFRKEFLIYHKEGYELWIDVTNSPIVDESGKVLKRIEIFTDITEKKRYELQLNLYSARLETLNMAKHELLNSHSVKEISSNVLGRLAARLSYVRRVSLAIYNVRSQEVELHYVIKDEAALTGMLLFPLKTFKSYTVLQENRVFVVKDLEREAVLSESDQENLAAGIRSYLMVPVFSNGELLGSINIGSCQANTISDDDVDMVREVADAIAIAIQQQRYLEIIEQKSADMRASILYARRIQEAILPPESMLRDHFNDMFILYKPKDVLSGDFFWAETRENFTYLAVVDSTGHGVPGALLSIMGNNLLNQAVHERNLVRPSAVLDYLNAGIQHTLNQYKNVGELRDGMDIALCVFDHESSKVQFAAAINPMYIIRDGMLIQSKANRFSIGSYFDNKMRPFTNQEMELLPGDLIYLFTDGYADQFGGDDDCKLSQRRFRELLMNVHHLPLEEQKTELERQLAEWMGDGQQTDDVCVIGIRMP